MKDSVFWRTPGQQTYQERGNYWGELTPAPNGMPKMMGIDQWIVVGRHVQEKTSCPMGVRMAPMLITLADASGRTRPVAGSFGCELINRRRRGSARIASMVPIPIPTNARPEMPGPHPLCCEKTIGYATKQRYLNIKSEQ